MNSTENKYWPCILVEHDDRFSIILSDFHLLDDYFGDKGCGGYSVERLARKLVKKHRIENIQFDSEAGMFCAYSKEQNALLQLCSLFAEIAGDQNDYEKDNKPLLISLDEAEKLLIKGFVMDLDKISQDKFYQNVPYPTLNKKQKEYLENIQSEDAKTRILALRKINAEARTLTRKWDNYLSHPRTIEFLLAVADKENDSKVYEELIATLYFICMRHLPDLRIKSHFLKCLKHKTAQVRLWGLRGLSLLYFPSIKDFEPLINDKSEKVRNKAQELIVQMQKQSRNNWEFPCWMFDRKNYII